MEKNYFVNVVNGNLITDLILYNKDKDDFNCQKDKNSYSWILIDLILTRDCNFRCRYCALNFEKKFMSIKVLLYLVRLVIKQLVKYFKFVDIEFFGWEPLLNYEIIYKTIKILKWFENIRYKLVTNWSLLNKEILEFLFKNKVEVVFSVSTNNLFMFKNNKYIDILKMLASYPYTMINFIIEPKEFKKLDFLADNLIKYWFKRISFIPVVYTMSRDTESVESAKRLRLKLENNKWLKLYYMRNTDHKELFSKEEIEIVIDYNWDIYFDNEVELYLLKDLVPNNVFNYGELKMWNVKTLLDLDKLRTGYNHFLKKRTYYFKSIVNYLKWWENFMFIKEIFN